MYQSKFENGTLVQTLTDLKGLATIKCARAQNQTRNNCMLWEHLGTN